MEEGDTLKLIFDNASSGETIIQMCEQAGHEILEQKKEAGKIIFTIEKG
jgi:TusA-related sulfurtransferase